MPLSSPKYSAYLAVIKGDVSGEDVSQYTSLFIENRDVEALSRLYEVTKEIHKLELLKIDPEMDFENYLSLFYKICDGLTNNEKEFFNSNAIIAYKQKIFKKMNGGN